MPTETPKRIVLKGDVRHEEYRAGGTVTPGHLLVLNSSSKVIAHNSEGGIAERMFAIEDALQGNTIDDNYSADDVVMIALAEPGAVVYAWLRAGSEASVGDLLVSGGDGTLIVDGEIDSLTTIKQYVAVALEDVDLTGSGATKGRIRVRVL